jgi:hypothetical protein
MSSTLGFSTINDIKSENTQEPKQENNHKKEQTSKGRNKTIKKRANKGKTFLNFIHNKPESENNEDDNLKNIQDLHKSEGNDVDDNINEYTNYSLLNNVTKNNNTEQEMLKLGKEQQLSYMEKNSNLNNGVDKYANNELTGVTDTINAFMPHKDTRFKNTNDGDLMKKLNYVIHLLEEQQDEKTGNITEELILYTFLGIFVIFIVDCFAKTSKYKR